MEMGPEDYSYRDAGGRLTNITECPGETSGRESADSEGLSASKLNGVDSYRLSSGPSPDLSEVSSMSQEDLRPSVTAAEYSSSERGADTSGGTTTNSVDVIAASPGAETTGTESTGAETTGTESSGAATSESTGAAATESTNAVTMSTDATTDAVTKSTGAITQSTGTTESTGATTSDVHLRFKRRPSYQIATNGDQDEMESYRSGRQKRKTAGNMQDSKSELIKRSTSSVDNSSQATIKLRKSLESVKSPRAVSTSVYSGSLYQSALERLSSSSAKDSSLKSTTSPNLEQLIDREINTRPYPTPLIGCIPPSALKCFADEKKVPSPGTSPVHSHSGMVLGKGPPTRSHSNSGMVLGKGSPARSHSGIW